MGHPARPLIDAIDAVILWVFVAEISLRILIFLTFRPPSLDFFSKSWLGRLGTHLVGRPAPPPIPTWRFISPTNSIHVTTAVVR